MNTVSVSKAVAASTSCPHFLALSIAMRADGAWRTSSMAIRVPLNPRGRGRWGGPSVRELRNYHFNREIGSLHEYGLP